MKTIFLENYPYSSSFHTETRRARNLNREVWESPSVYGGEDVKKEWGTKSYEFSLEKVPAQHQKLEAESSTKPPELDKLFKAHCYFGLKSDSRTQDAFQHLKCYDSGYGGSTLALDFVLRELGLRG